MQTLFSVDLFSENFFKFQYLKVLQSDFSFSQNELRYRTSIPKHNFFLAFKKMGIWEREQIRAHASLNNFSDFWEK